MRGGGWVDEKIMNHEVKGGSNISEQEAKNSCPGRSGNKDVIEAVPLCQGRKSITQRDLIICRIHQSVCRPSLRE